MEKGFNSQPIWKLMLRLGIPAMFAQMFNILYSIVDRMFVGNIEGVGELALASIGMDPFPMQAHGITLPAVYDPATFTAQAVKAFIMVTVAAIIPAFIVSRQDPAKALRSN